MSFPKQVKLDSVISFHDYISKIPFHLRSSILDYYDFSCGKLHISKNCSVTILIFRNLKFWGVNESRWDGGSKNRLSSKQIMRYLYGYYREDRFRKINLVRKSFTISFKFSKVPNRYIKLDLANFIPRGTRSFQFEIRFSGHDEAKLSKVLSLTSLSFSNFPPSVQKIITIGKNLPLELEWKKVDFKCLSNVLDYKSANLSSMESLRDFHKQLGHVKKLHLLLNIHQISEKGRFSDLVFRSVRNLKLTMNFIYSDYDWIYLIFPNVQKLTIEVPSSKITTNYQFLPSSLFSSLKTLPFLKTLDIHCIRRHIRAEDLSSFLNHNHNLRTLHIDSCVPENSIWSTFENTSLQNLNFFHCGIEAQKKITLSMIETLFRSLKQLKHFGLVNRLERHNFGHYLHTSGIGGLLSYSALGGTRGTSLADKELLSFFSDKDADFSNLESLWLYLPTINISANFFRPSRKWKNLKTLHLCCKNDRELIISLSDSSEKIPIRDFHTTSKLLPSLLLKISKFPTLVYLTGVKIDEEFIPFFRYKAPHIRVVGRNDHFDNVYQRCQHRETPLIVDPMRRYRFDNFDVEEEDSIIKTYGELVDVGNEKKSSGIKYRYFVDKVIGDYRKISKSTDQTQEDSNIMKNMENNRNTEEEEEEEEKAEDLKDSFLMKCVKKWGLTAPFSTNFDWEKYYKNRVRRMGCMKDGEVFGGDLCDDDETKKYGQKQVKIYLESFESYFRDEETGKFVEGVNLTEEEFMRLKNSLFLHIHPEYYGYNINTTIYSLIGSGVELSFSYNYYSKYDTFEHLKMFLPRRKSRFSEGRCLPVGYTNFGRDSREDCIPIFAKNRHDKFDVTNYDFADIWTLRKIEMSLFGRNNVFSLKQLIRFFYIACVTELEFYYGESNNCRSRDWILRMSECEYGIPLDFDEDGRKRDYKEWRKSTNEEDEKNRKSEKRSQDLFGISKDYKTGNVKVDYFESTNSSYWENVEEQLETEKERNKGEDDCSVM